MSQSESAAEVPLDALYSAAANLFAAHKGLTYIACTDGRFPATFLNRDGEAWRIVVPPLPRALVSVILKTIRAKHTFHLLIYTIQLTADWSR